ncbi:MAG: SdiA-regulated family protein, partial [Pedobacter sp.]
MKANLIKLHRRYFLFAVLTLIVSLSSWSCAEKKAVATQNPKGYDLENPKRYSMPDILQEISGIAFNKGDNSIVYAQQDEDGILFSLPLGTKDDKATKFGKKGDYEDVSVAQGWAILLKSNGTFYTFPLTETSKEEVANVIETKNLVPKGEYEGMFANETTGDVYVLCKDCKVDKDTKKTSGY